MTHRAIWLFVATAALTGCASRNASSPAPAPAPTAAAAPAPAAKAAPPKEGEVRMVKSRDGTYEGEMVGTPAPGSKFSKVQIGMDKDEVTRLIGSPTSYSANPTGKNWIPFYYGGDTHRVHLSYKGEGCLSFANNSRFSSGDYLARITVDPSGASC